MKTIKSYPCPCCGAPLIFDAGAQALMCHSCSNKFELRAIQEITDAENASTSESKYDWDTYEPRNYEDTGKVCLSGYSCPSCGAEITGDDTLGSTVCPYCGQSTIIKSQFEGTLRPDYIIPFCVDKKAAVAAFEADFKNVPFLPDEFKVKKKIEEMAGVYVPFWMFDCDCNGAVSYDAQRVTMWSDANYNYKKIDYYRLFRSGRIGFANIPVDGSQKADDAYMEAVEPYDYKAAVTFDEAYLSGYLADKYDVTAEDSINRANERVENSIIEAFNDSAFRYNSVIPESASVSFSNGKIRYALLPVWMLNIKYKNMIYKFAINGQTGKVVGEYPVDKRKKWWFFTKILGVGYILAAFAGWLLLR